MCAAQCDTRWPPRADLATCFGVQTASRTFFISAETEFQSSTFRLELCVALIAAENAATAPDGETASRDVPATRLALGELLALIEADSSVATLFAEVGINVQQIKALWIQLFTGVNLSLNQERSHLLAVLVTFHFHHTHMP